MGARVAWRGRALRVSSRWYAAVPYGVPMSGDTRGEEKQPQNVEELRAELATGPTFADFLRADQPYAVAAPTPKVGAPS